MTTRYTKYMPETLEGRILKKIESHIPVLCAMHNTAYQASEDGAVLTGCRRSISTPIDTLAWYMLRNTIRAQLLIDTTK